MPSTDTAVMTPSQRYQRDLASGALAEDAAQAMAIGHFQRLYDELMAPTPTTGSVLTRLMSRFQAAEPARAKGLYVYGGVGRGKTYLMDVFFESLPFERKMRTHFHRFMQRVHAELNQLKMQKNPLELVARKIAAEARVICFDGCHDSWRVTDSAN